MLCTHPIRRLFLPITNSDRAPVCSVFRSLEPREAVVAIGASSPALDTLPLWTALRVIGLENATTVINQSAALVLFS